MEDAEQVYKDLMSRISKEHPLVSAAMKMHIFGTDLDRIEDKNIEHGREIASELRDIQILVAIIVKMGSMVDMDDSMGKLFVRIVGNLAIRREDLIKVLITKILK